MLDFTSAHSLGLEHPSRALRPWPRLGTGAPAALHAPPGSGRVERLLARLIGAEDALLGPSTLHLALDLFHVLTRDPATLFVDDSAYPVGRWAVERSALGGARVQQFPAHDPRALGEALQRDRGGRRAIVVADGVFGPRGELAPVRAYAELAARHGGLLVLDDTQALGLLGAGASPARPLGSGGGGSLRRHGVPRRGVLVSASLNKAFGAPAAVLAGPREWVAAVRDGGPTRVHCSPVSAAAVRAAERALELNRRVGDRLRSRLTRNVRLFRGALARAGLSPLGGELPVQSLGLGGKRRAERAQRRLAAHGVRAVLRAEPPGLAFLITAAHGARDVLRAAHALRAALTDLEPVASATAEP